MSLYSPPDFTPKTPNESRIRMSLNLIAPALAGLWAQVQDLIANIAKPQTYSSGAFLVTLNGVTTTVTGDAYFVQHGKWVSLFLPVLSGISNAVTCTITGLPFALWPKRVKFLTVPEVQDNSLRYTGALEMKTTGVIGLRFYISTAAGITSVFTNANNKGLTAAADVSYNLL